MAHMSLLRLRRRYHRLKGDDDYCTVQAEPAEPHSRCGALWGISENYDTFLRKLHTDRHPGPIFGDFL